MLSKTCVKAALLLIPPGAAAHPVPLPCVCPPPADAACLHFFWVAVAVPSLCPVG